MKQTILGAGGAIGIELAKALASYTSEIRLVSRNPQKVNQTDHLFPADLSKRAEVFSAVKDSQVTYVAIGFPYQTSTWKANWPSFIQNVVDACLEYHSKLVFFDNVYAIGGNNVNHITERSPISPTSKKGEVRAEVDRIILENMEKNNLQAIIARAPDFFGGTARQSSVLMNLVYDNLIKDEKAQWFCKANICHSMGYVPDLAKGTAMLGNTPEAYNQIWNLPTDLKRTTGEEWINLFAKELGKDHKVTVLPNWLVKGFGLFVPVMKELAEMNYQYDRAYFFDSSKFNTYFNFTPVTAAVAVQQAIAQMNDINKATNTK